MSHSFESAGTSRFLYKYYLVLLSLFSLIVIVFFYVKNSYPDSYHSVFPAGDDTNFILLLIYILAGAAAQMIDGSLGMAYGVSSTTFLISAGVPPATASASVHLSEVFTTLASGISHWKFGNIDKKLFKSLALPGVIGAAVGAWVLSSFDGSVIKPYISTYLFLMGVYIIIKSFRTIVIKETKKVGWLALLGGFVDASGGGGWGPVVTTNLIAMGNVPRYTIGTVNAVEFLVTVSASGVFTLMIGITNIFVVAGLIIGGIIAAPLGGWLAHKINHKAAMVAVGTLIMILSGITLYKTLFQ